MALVSDRKMIYERRISELTAQISVSQNSKMKLWYQSCIFHVNMDFDFKAFLKKTPLITACYW